MWNKPIETYSVPDPGSPGSFAFVRKHHIHEGIDLYCDNNTPVCAVESGIVINVTPFTGVKTNSPWWNDTYAVFIAGASGVVVYGELVPIVKLNASIKAGQHIGNVIPVLKKNKGRPMTMLHLELRDPNYEESNQLFDWSLNTPQPVWLLDPTNLINNIT